MKCISDNIKGFKDVLEFVGLGEEYRINSDLSLFSFYCDGVTLSNSQGYTKNLDFSLE